MNWIGQFLMLGVTMVLSVPAVFAATWMVDPGSNGAFPTIQAGLDAAQPGDEVVVVAGTYHESLTTRRHGTAEARITVRAAPGARVMVTQAGRVLDVQHAFFSMEGFILDGQFGAQDLVLVRSEANHFTLRNSEVRRSARDCIDMGGPEHVLIEGVRIHHCLFWDGQRRDAHGITGGGVRGLTVRNTEIFYVSGDAMQFSPGRAFWDDITVEDCHLWNGPLPETVAGFMAGQVPGENAVDTKTPSTGPRPRLRVRNCLMHGFQGVIPNQAAMNIKENVDVMIDRITIYDSDVGFRLRAPAHVTVTNCVLYNVGRGVRYEDGIDVLQLYNCTFGQGIPQPFQDVGGTPEVRNSLFLAESKPSEANDNSNLTAATTHFAAPAMHDYRLVQSAPAIDAGLPLDIVLTDRNGVKRPQGVAFDVGAYEFISSPADTQPPAPPGRIRILQ